MPEFLPVRSWWTPKAGHTASEYEDAFAHHQHRYAIADGASESSFAGLWAQLLVEQFVQQVPDLSESVGWAKWLPGVQSAWNQQAGGANLPWYAQEKLQDGAYAAFLGLEVGPVLRGKRQWQAIAVGDCCVLQWRKGTLIQRFPLTSAAAFDNRPVLIRSRGPAPNEGPTGWRVTGQRAEPGDVLVLATDALAHWFLAQADAGAKPWTLLAPVLAGADFAGWVQQQRQTGQLRNDDTTLLVLAVD
jgi:hypothetical protein